MPLPIQFVGLTEEFVTFVSSKVLQHMVNLYILLRSLVSADLLPKILKACAGIKIIPNLENYEKQRFSERKYIE